MISTSRAQAGGFVWTDVGPPQLWLLSKVISVKEKGFKTQIIGNTFADTTNEENGKIYETIKVLGFDTQQMENFDDALRMSGELNEASLLQLLRRRFGENIIYTFLGDVLISMNPYQDVGALTALSMPSPDELEEKERTGLVVPHLHVVSERAHRKMLTHGPKGTSQSILINGESGSGKTEAAKCIMKCLAQRSFAKRQVLKKQATAGLNQNLKRMGIFGASQLENRGVSLLGRGKGKGANKILSMSQVELDGSEDVVDVGSKVEKSFLLANPLLEAFGNAKTVNNHNSSRFGKFVKIEYDDDGCIVGTSTRAFFLEKSRLVRRALGERNFHSFYQMINAYRSKHEIFQEGFEELEKFSQDDPNLLRIGTTRKHDSDDEEEEDMFNEDLASFEATNKSMETMSIDEQHVKFVWKLLSVILSIGELEFGLMPEEKDNLERSFISKGLEVTAGLLPVDPQVLQMALCQRSIRAGKRGSVSYTPMSPERARESNEGLAKAVYNSLFMWLVQQINDTSSEATQHVEKSRRKEALFIGVLDIFGFEVLNLNSFEQLCINYANEVMQKFFDVHVFELEHHIYKEEGVDSSKFTFRDNSPIIQLLSGKPSGIFRILDESCMMGDAATDSMFLQKIETAHRSETQYYGSRPNLHIDGQFEVKHFAGSVIYDVREIISKNKDILEPDLAELLRSFAKQEQGTFTHFVGSVFVSSQPDKDAEVPAVFKQEVSNRRLANLETVSGRFRSQMQDLSNVLEQTDQHFIRCVKPNKFKRPSFWDAPIVLHQLKYLSVMEMVRIRTEGFPIRILFADLVSKFPELLWPTKFSWYPGSNDKRACEALLRSALGEKSEGVLWVLGASKCFLRDGVLDRLLNLVRSRKHYGAIQVQKLVRGYQQRRRYRTQRAAAIKIQRWFRTFMVVSEAKKHQLATKIQCMVRQKLARNEKKKRLDAIIKIQRFRRLLMREKRARKMRAIAAIQAWFRACRVRKAFWKFRLNVVRLQARLRGCFVRKRYYQVLEMREPWKEMLRPNEAIVLTSLVMKMSDIHGVRGLTKKGGILGGLFSSKKHRQLIFTTGPGVDELDPQFTPRLFYANPTTKQWKGEIAYDPSITCGLSLGDKDFVIFSKKNDEKQDKTPIWNFSDVLGPAVCWIRSIRRNVSVLELVRDRQPVEFHTRMRPAMSGPLLMRQLFGPKKYLDLFFTLVESDIWWIHSPGQGTPSGGVNITGQCKVRVIDEPRKIPDVPEYAFWLDTPCRAKPLKFRTSSPSEMKKWVVAIEKVIQKCIDDEKTKNDPVALADRVYQSGCILFDSSDFLNSKLKFTDAIDLLVLKGKDRKEGIQIQFDCLEHRARCNFILGLYEKALADSTAGLKLRLNDESCMRTRAAGYAKLKQYQESLQAYDELIAKFPEATDLKTLRERTANEMLNGKSSAKPTRLTLKAPAIARQYSKDFIKAGATSGLLSMPQERQGGSTGSEHSRPSSMKISTLGSQRSTLANPVRGLTKASRRFSNDSIDPVLVGGSTIEESVTWDEPSIEMRTITEEIKVGTTNNTRKNTKFLKGEIVEHYKESENLIRRGRVVGIHVDDPPTIYYSIILEEEDGYELQSSESKLRSIGKWEEELAERGITPTFRPPKVVGISKTVKQEEKKNAENKRSSQEFSKSIPENTYKENEVVADKEKPFVKPQIFKLPSAPSVPPPSKPLRQDEEEESKLKRRHTPPVESNKADLFNAKKPAPLDKSYSTSAVFQATSSAPTSPSIPESLIANKLVGMKADESIQKKPAPLDKSLVDQGGVIKSAPTSPVLQSQMTSKSGIGGSPASLDGNVRQRKMLKKPTIAKAIADYIPKAETANEDLTFRKGDEILVLHKYKDGWWKGSFQGKQGLFPSTYVAEVKAESTSNEI